MDKHVQKDYRWVGVLIGLVIEFGLFWIVGVGFMSYGICWRTALTVVLMVALRLTIKITGEMKKVKTRSVNRKKDYLFQATDI